MAESSPSPLTPLSFISDIGSSPPPMRRLNPKTCGKLSFSNEDCDSCPSPLTPLSFISDIGSSPPPMRRLNPKTREKISFPNEDYDSCSVLKEWLRYIWASQRNPSPQEAEKERNRKIRILMSMRLKKFEFAEVRKMKGFEELIIRQRGQRELWEYRILLDATTWDRAAIE